MLNGVIIDDFIPSFLEKYGIDKNALTKRQEEDKTFGNLIIGLIKNNIQFTERIIIKSSIFPTVSSFSYTLFQLANFFREEENIDIEYSKPESKDKSMCCPTFTVTNTKLVTEREAEKIALKDLANKVKQLTKK